MSENENRDEKKVAAALARSAALSADQRRDIASKAASARWSLPEATHGDPEHPLRVGEIEIPCYVLNDGRRVLIQAGMLSGMDMRQGTAAGGTGDRLAKFINTKAISPFVPEHLHEMIINPVKFRISSGRGSTAYGYEATVLADLCDVVLEARKNGTLNYQQFHIADRCEILVRGFARVGIIALVDEATGYQQVRDRDALQEILDKYLRKEFAAWAKTFPDEFYREIFRLRKWQWKGMKVNRPQCVANYTKDIVYARLAPGILQELEVRNPVLENGKRKGRHFQLLTEEIGHPALSQHLHAVIGLMRAAESWEQFMKMINRAFRKRGDSLQLEMFGDNP